MDISDFSITIVGLGLIGGSYAMALRKLAPRNLWGVDIDEETLVKAENLGIIDKGYKEAREPISSSDIVIISVYPQSVEKFVKDNISYFKDGAIITDTGGIKKSIIDKVFEVLPQNIDFIGGHPISGREDIGLAFATADIFNNANYILTPVEKNKEKNIKIIDEIAKLIGCKNVIRMSPQRHDEIIAYTSQLPHIIAVSLMNSDNTDMDISCISGGSFKDTTRIAVINCKLWSELLISNKDNIINTIEDFQNRIDSLKNAIINDDIDAIEENLKSACKKRRELQK